MIWLKTWWPALVTLALIAAFVAHGALKKHEGKTLAQTTAKIERLESEASLMNEAIQIRIKQNEIRNNRPDTPALVDSLLRGAF